MKKSQEGTSAAILVAVISGLIILYILFLPADEKRALLEEDSTSSGSTKKTTTLLFSEKVDEILEPSNRVDDRFLPNVLLVEEKNAQVIDTINPFAIRNGWFDKKSKISTFKIDPENSANIQLSFSAQKRKGILILKLNNEVIYESVPTKSNVIIELKSDLLKTDNTLEFSVSSVGLSFWSTNEYSLDEVKIIADISDKSRQKSESMIELTESEFINLEKADLRFTPFCSNLEKVKLGILDVYVNNRRVYSSVPICEDRVQVPIFSALNQGQNEITFKSSGGRYSIEQIRVDLELKEPKVLTFYFEVSSEQMEDISKNEKSANLTIDFVDDDKNKRAEISLNGHLIRIDQLKPLFNIPVSQKLREGNNYIEIRPKTTLKIVNVKVLLTDN